MSVNVNLQKKASDITASVASTVAKAGDIKINLAAGLNDMTGGLSANSKNCKDSLSECAEFGQAGVKQFKRGAKTVEVADSDFDKLKKEVSNTLNTLKSVQSDLSRSVNQLDAIFADDEAWEQKTNLNARNAKGFVKTIAGKYSTASKDTEAMVGKITQVDELLRSKTAKENRKAVAEGMRAVSSKLEKADRYVLECMRARVCA